FGNQGDDFPGELHVLGFLGVDAQPGEMRQTEFGGALRFVIGELAEVIVEAFRPAAIVARPKGGFADGLAAGGDHRLVIVSHAADHVSVGFDIAHGQFPPGPGQAPTAPLPGALGMGSVVGSLSDMRTLLARTGSFCWSSWRAWRKAARRKSASPSPRSM